MIYAVLGAHMPLEHHDLDDVKNLFDVNVFGALATTQYFLPRIRKDKVSMPSITGLYVFLSEGIRECLTYVYVGSTGSRYPDKLTGR